MTDGFAVQMSYKLGPNSGDLLNVRGNSVQEFAANLEALKNGIVPILQVGELLRSTPINTQQALANLQAGGLNPVVIGEVHPPAQPTIAQAAPPPAAPAAAFGSNCVACGKTPECPDCGNKNMTHMVTGKAKQFNTHRCTDASTGRTNFQHKPFWCTTPIPFHLQNAVGVPGLVYGA